MKLCLCSMTNGQMCRDKIKVYRFKIKTKRKISKIGEPPLCYIQSSGFIPSGIAIMRHNSFYVCFNPKISELKAFWNLPVKPRMKTILMGGTTSLPHWWHHRKLKFSNLSPHYVFIFILLLILFRGEQLQWFFFPVWCFANCNVTLHDPDSLDLQFSPELLGKHRKDLTPASKIDRSKSNNPSAAGKTDLPPLSLEGSSGFLQISGGVLATMGQSWGGGFLHDLNLHHVLGIVVQMLTDVCLNMQSNCICVKQPRCMATITKTNTLSYLKGMFEGFGEYLGLQTWRYFQRAWVLGP